MSEVSSAPIASYVKLQTDVITTRQGDVLTNGPDAIHATRVACRRLRSTLQTFHPLWSTRHHGLLRDLRWYGRQLGAPRDTEVLEEALLDLLSRIDEPGTDLAATRLRATLDGDRNRGLTLLVASMRGARFSRLTARVETLDSFADWDDVAEVPAERLLPALAYAPVVQVARLAVRLPEAGDLRLLALHEVRKKAKAARYAYEAIGPAAASQAALWKVITESLGTVQDRHVGLALIARLQRQAAAADEPQAPYDALRGLLAAQLEQGERDGLTALAEAIASAP